MPATKKTATVSSATAVTGATPAAAAPATTPVAPPAPPMPPAATPASPTPPGATPPASPPTAPDPNVALAAFAQEAVATIDTIAAGLGADPGLTPKDKVRSTKFRKGGGPIVSTIGDLAQQQQLELPPLPVATMLSLLARANAVAPLVSRLAALVALVNDIMFASQSQAWGMALQYYALLSRRAKADNKLAAALVPVSDFLAYRHPSTKPAVGQPTQKQTRAAKKAQKALATIAGGKLANVDLIDAGKGTQLAQPATAAPSASSASATPASNGGSANGAAPVTNGSSTPAAH
ncbi:MAG TPA: hypothetical protein VIY73_07455 [Polyangiaceae bacterium]